MKKITIIEIIAVVILISAISIYFVPKLLLDKKVKTLAIVKANNAVFTSKVIEEFAHDKNALPSSVAKKVTEELNKTQKNPFTKDEVFYRLDNGLSSCSNIEFDDAINMVIITTLDDKGELISRIVIKPPSFVTYYKENEP